MGFFAALNCSFLIMCKGKNQENAYARPLSFSGHLVVNVHSSPISDKNSSNLVDLGGRKRLKDPTEERFEKLIKSRNRKLASMDNLFNFPAEIINNFYIANYDERGRFDLVAKALDINRINVFPDHYSGFMDGDEARRKTKDHFAAFLKTIQSGRVKTLDLREVYIPPEYYSNFIQNLNIETLEIGYSTFRFESDGIRFTRGFSEILAENIIFNRYFLEAIKGNHDLNKISISHGIFHGALNSPISNSSAALIWLDDFRRDSSKDFENLNEIVLRDSDPRILTTISWLHFPSLQYLNISNENIIFHGGALEDDFVQSVICAIRKDSKWPNIRQISISRQEDYMKLFGKRAETNHNVKQHLQKIIDEFCMVSKLDMIRQYEIEIVTP